jgi:hypothetical protein
MRTLYICPKDVALIAHKHLASYHYIDLPDGIVLLSGEGNTDGFEQHVTVEPLPDLYDPSPIADHHADRLTHLGVKRGHKAIDVRNAARKIVRLM